MFVLPVFCHDVSLFVCHYLEDNGIFSKYQSGFRKSKSTNDHLFCLSQTIREESTPLLEGFVQFYPGTWLHIRRAYLLRMEGQRSHEVALNQYTFVNIGQVK